MGEREIVERKTVEQTKEVTGCDFCGRDESEVDGSFDEVLKNPRYTSVKNLHTPLSIDDELISKEKIDASITKIEDREWHLCHQCSSAFTEAVDDDDD